MEMQQRKEAHILHWLLFWAPSNPFQGNLTAALHISRKTQEHRFPLGATARSC